jgi:hypothetical protein
MFQEAVMKAEERAEWLIEEKLAADIREELRGKHVIPAVGRTPSLPRSFPEKVMRTPTTPRPIPEKPTPVARQPYNTSVTPTTTNRPLYGQVYKLCCYIKK